MSARRPGRVERSPANRRRDLTYSSRPQADLGAARQRLRGLIRRISTEPMSASHPILGRLTADQRRRLHSHRAAHHLSFVIPDSSLE